MCVARERATVINFVTVASDVMSRVANMCERQGEKHGISRPADTRGQRFPDFGHSATQNTCYVIL